MNRPPAFALAVSALITGHPAVAQTPLQPGASFLRTFAGLCVRRVGNFEALRSELKAKGFPTLLEPAARAFLGGRPGDVWPIPESGVAGNLVLVLPADRPECSVLARRGPIAKAEAEFRQLAAGAPFPLSSELKSEQTAPTIPNGDVHTLGYEWKLDGKAAYGLFLSTSASFTATVQLKATLAKVAGS
jgi:hypothetical protein